MNFYYDEAATTTTDESHTEAYTRSEFAFLFFSGSTSSSSSESSYSSKHMRSVVQTGDKRQKGGDPSIKDAGKWCKSVRTQPALVGYNKVVPLSELVHGDDSGKYAMFMAIMDKWYCNGGTAFDFDRTKGTVKCKCPEIRDGEYILDNRCQPIDAKCKSSTSKMISCVHGKIIVGFASSYSQVVRITKGEYLAFYLQRPDIGYALMGSLGFNRKTYVSGRTAVVSLRTSETLVKPASDFSCVWRNKISSASYGDVYLTSWRPICPDGYTGISDFIQRGTDEPPRGIYRGYTLRPCIVNSCLKTCSLRWLWDDCHAGAGPNKEIFISIAGGQAKYGSEPGSAGAFYRAVSNYYKTSYDLPTYLTQCLKPECILEE